MTFRISTFIFLISLLALSEDLFAQQTRGVSPIDQSESTEGTTRAVIIGISDYQSREIPDLKFAHRDAMEFAHFLRSKAGGSVPEENIKMLLNERATQGQMAAALSWLIDESQPNDKAIIYFSGHGDMESKTIANHGFLLAYDAPPTTYMAGGAFPVFYLQSIISTLSNEKIQVTMITDACRSGKLAGDEIQGKQATAKMLSDQFANEIKILSCQPNEYSLEGEQWGHGRGIFSYYLINGLYGMADNNKDQKISLLEIGRFLEDKVVTESADVGQTQIPMTIGNKGATLSQVDQDLLANIQKEMESNDADLLAARNISKKGIPEGDSTTLKQFKDALAAGHLLYPQAASAYTIYKELVNGPKARGRESAINSMKLELSAALQDEAQTAIQSYLKAPDKELRRRWQLDSVYRHFPEYLAVAAALEGPDQYNYRELQCRHYYFAGLELRIRAESSGFPDSLFQKAIEKQTEALKWQEDAPFVYNELGLLHRRLRQFESAAGFFKQANELSPKWPLPLNNLALTYRDLGQDSLAMVAANLSILAKPDFWLPYMTKGGLLSRRNEFQKAVEWYLKALPLTTDSSDLMYNLGNTYVQLQDYQQAEKALAWCLEQNPSDVYVLVTLGVLYMENGKIKEAREMLLKAREINPNDPWISLNIGRVHFEEAAYAEALPYFKEFTGTLPGQSVGWKYQLETEIKLDRLNEAMGSLNALLEAGFRDFEYLEQSEQLAPIRAIEAFGEMIKAIRQ